MISAMAPIVAVGLTQRKEKQVLGLLYSFEN